ncbi:site-specific integrase [Cupriavidus alkaliphilus]|uniref:site-specific integrase n=1 Tax=Cupriavidus alkaliphilus TaxID=942866 RepID=UPI000E3012D8|nr:site-specific integrase [Cupriavidus alkaliphilus]
MPMLLDGHGVPVYLPTLYVTTQIRNASKAPNTMLAVLDALRWLLRWADGRGISLEQRFKAKVFLNDTEIESLRAFAQTKSAVRGQARPKVIAIPRRTEGARLSRTASSPARISTNAHYVRLSYIAHYVNWLGNHILDRSRADEADRKALARMVTRIEMSRPRVRRGSSFAARRSLDATAQQRLAELVRLTFPGNPFATALRIRNALIISLLSELGVRAGELLALKIQDFDVQANEVIIARRHDDPQDPRPNQPVAKTLDRRLPLTPELSKAVYDYVLHDRCKLRRAKRHDFLIVTHQSGPHEGLPMSIKGLEKIFALLRSAEPKLAKLTPHVLRHTWNERFSARMDASNTTVADEEKMRSHWMGWREASGSAAMYLPRRTEQLAKQAALQLQTPRANGRGRHESQRCCGGQG